MAEVKTDQEPSIEEILESIRQIISEDGKEPVVEEKTLTLVSKPAPPPPASDLNLSVAAQPVAPASNLDLSAAETAAVAVAAEVVLDLVERVDPAPVATAPSQVPPPQPQQTPVAAKTMDVKPMTDETNNLISAQTASAATEALSKLLVGNVAVETEAVGKPGKVTLEEMTRELMRPLIKSWLDENLPGVIEKIVQKEIEKLSRRALDR